MIDETILNKLIQLKTELEQRIERTQEHIRHVDGPISPDFEEQAVERENDDVIYQIDDRAKTDLQEVEAAINRLKSGTYGKCVECGERISEERLNAVPLTKLCAVCASESDNTGC